MRPLPTGLCLALIPAAISTAADAAAGGRKNVLYIVYDDLRPDLSLYNLSFMHTPNLQKLADTGTVFDRAYCQQTVCAPSRMSFTTGRRPNSTRTWNFLNHFRQAECKTERGVVLTGTPLTTAPPAGYGFHGNATSWSFSAVGSEVQNTGGSGQCCTSCTSAEGCAGWVYRNKTCTLLASITGKASCTPTRDNACLSGEKGRMPTWTSLPQAFRHAGYTTLGAGKYFHDGCGGLGGAPYDSPAGFPGGTGLPPQQDPASWTPGLQQFPNIAEEYARFGSAEEYPNGFQNSFEGCSLTGGKGYAYVDAQDELCRGHTSPSDPHGSFCNPDIDLNGSGAPGAPLCDYVSYIKAIEHLQYAKRELDTKQTPFFVVAGIRRPHLNWRAPIGYLKHYEPIEETAMPLQLTLDESIDPIAWTAFGSLGGMSPHNLTNTPAIIKGYRAHYYAAVSWGDYVAGRVLDELDRLDLTKDTLVVCHSDHGWHLGEYNMWEKRTLWENSARVPLIIRAPWLTQMVGKRSQEIVELVDIYRTVLDLAGGVPEPTEDTLPIEGKSLAPLLGGGGRWEPKPALTMYPRCPPSSAAGEDWVDDACIHTVERSEFAYMGYSMRVDASATTDGFSYRYTEWVAWDGDTLSPVWSKVHATELYNHSQACSPAGTIFDCYENKNGAADAPPQLLSELSATLRAAFGFGMSM